MQRWPRPSPRRRPRTKPSSLAPPTASCPRPGSTTTRSATASIAARRRASRPLTAIDLGTGSGAIALALAAARPGARLLATDLSAAAITVAQRNALRLDLAPQVQWAQGAWWQPVPPDARFGLVVSNPPYIAGDDPHLPALRHEPRLALTPEGDGLGALREIVGGASAHLAVGAWLLLEHGYDQAEAVRALLSQAGFSSIASRRDLGGQWRCSGGRWST